MRPGDFTRASYDLTHLWWHDVPHDEAFCSFEHERFFVSIARDDAVLVVAFSPATNNVFVMVNGTAGWKCSSHFEALR